MDEVNAEFIERYQKLYEQDPQSKVFAPLAEAYRKMGMLKEGIALAEKGVSMHPDFPGGRVALARLYLDKNLLNEADRELRKAVALSPENMLAHQLLAETNLKLKKPKEALKSYKMLLFLSPNHERALKAVKKLESLTADEFEDEVFSMKPLTEAVKEWDEIHLDYDFGTSSQNKGLQTPEEDKKKQSFLERVLSLADAYLVRNDTDRALDALNEAEKWIGPDPEIVKRLKLIHQRQMDSLPQKTSASFSMPAIPLARRQETIIDNQIECLQDLLQKFKNRQIGKQTL